MGRTDRREGSALRWTAAALVLYASTIVSACHFPISQEVVYLPERGEPVPIKAAKKNDLSVGIRKLEVVREDGTEASEDEGDPRDLGSLFAEAIGDTATFARIVYPYRGEEVDVLLEPRLMVGLSKNRGTNALKVLPGLLVVWIDGMGFDYDYHATLEVAVRNGKRQNALADTFKADAARLAERYPSVLWFLGLHAGLILLMVIESVTTDQAVLEKLIEQTLADAQRPVLERLVREFEPVPKRCPEHPDLAQTVRYCIYDGRDLYYPILDRGDAAPPKKGEKP